VLTLSSAASSPAPVCGVRASLDWGALGAADVARLVALLADDDVEFDDFSVADRANGLLRVVLEDGSLVDKDVLLGVVAVDEAVAGLDVKPLHGASNFAGDDLEGEEETI
jgi:hypothetical protein